MKRISVALTMVALSAYGLGCAEAPKPATPPAATVTPTADGGAKVETPAGDHVEVKPGEEKPAEAAPEAKPEEKPAEAAPEAKPEEKPAEEKPAEEKPAEEKPAEEKKAEEKPAEEKPAEEKPAEEKKAE